MRTLLIHAKHWFFTRTHTLDGRRIGSTRSSVENKGGDKQKSGPTTLFDGSIVYVYVYVVVVVCRLSVEDVDDHSTLTMAEFIGGYDSGRRDIPPYLCGRRAESRHFCS